VIKDIITRTATSKKQQFVLRKNIDHPDFHPVIDGLDKVSGVARFRLQHEPNLRENPMKKTDRQAEIFSDVFPS
jgi:hypothetical protein